MKEYRAALNTAIRLGLAVCAVWFAAAAIIALLHFPTAVDPDPSQRDSARPTGEAFYTESYDPESSDVYVRKAREAAQRYDVEGMLASFVSEYKLSQKRVLEVGAGSGLLQDIVEDYTALDIAPSAARFFHKPFVVGSATNMPFPNDEFDVIWTVWVLEHVPSPEWALLEMRRVVKDGGLLYLAPAWNCVPWAAQGYEIRPYRDLDVYGKLVKASIPVRQHYLFQWLQFVPVRSMRYASWRLLREPTRLRYRRLNPNYEKYWVPDSDAVNSIDSFEVYLWFVSRGDECLNCNSGFDEVRIPGRWPLIIKVRKR